MRRLTVDEVSWVVAAALAVALAAVITFVPYKQLEEPLPAAPAVEAAPPVVSSVEKYLISRLDSTRGKLYGGLIIKYSTQHSLPPELIAGIMLHESGGHEAVEGQLFTLARSSGENIPSIRAKGLMQIVWELWEGVFPECGTDIFLPRVNICYGTKIFRIYVDRENGNYEQALVAYSGRASNYTNYTLQHAAKVYLSEHLWNEE